MKKICNPAHFRTLVDNVRSGHFSPGSLGKMMSGLTPLTILLEADDLELDVEWTVSMDDDE
jgi:hypothetical protein